MGRIDSFWAGARAVSDRVDVGAVAKAAGGWGPLQAGSARDWIGWGVEPAMAHAWASARPDDSLGEVITLADPRYPVALRDLPHAPPVLCVEGDVSAFSREGVAVVGTRACTRYGASAARRLGHAFAAAGRAVVSGLARGIDGEAHRGALEAGVTVAVLGHGLSHTAPSRHKGLREAIVAAGGCVLSVYPDALPPRPHTFPERNRWIAGLSRGVVVVEAPYRSGALHTARFALAMGREIAAVPGRMGDEVAQGTNQLLADGATVVTSVDALVEAWTQVRPPSPDAWLSAVLDGVPLEEVARRAGRPVTAVLSDLSVLEVQGRVVRLAGGRYALRGGPEAWVS